MNYVYYHDQDNGRTFVIDMPSKAELLKLNTISENLINLKLGVAFKNPKDQFYVKKIGREIAVESIESAPAHLFHREDFKEHVSLSLDVDGFLIYIKLTKNISSPIISYVQDKYENC